MGGTKPHLLFILLWTTNGLFAQNISTISGKIIDNQGSPLMWAIVSLETTDSTALQSTNTDEGGFFAFNAWPGDFLIRISLMGFEEKVLPLTLSQSADLGNIQLNETAINLTTITINNDQVAVRQMGDTTQFSADQFKTNPDATAEDLLSKMPGVTSENGTVKAQGEEVKKVLVDGKPFFGDDPNIALKNIPAKMIDKVQVFDQESKKAQATGYNDGDEEKTINIITKKEYQTGTFGNLYLGYGTSETYQIGGVVNIFDKQRRITVLGQSNNINEQNFSSSDLSGVSGNKKSWHRHGPSASDFMVDQQGGISRTHAGGINYYESFSDQLQLTANYFINRNSNKNTSTLSQDYFSTNAQNYSQNSSSISENTTHRFAANLEYSKGKNSFQIRPKLTLQNNDGSNILDGQTFQRDSLLNTTDNNFASSLSAFNFQNRIDWTYKFEKKGRSIAVDMQQFINKQDANSLLNVYNQYYGTNVNDTIDQTSSLYQFEQTYSADFDYTEPLTENLNLRLSFEPSWSVNDGDKYTYNSVFTPFYEPELDSTLSNVALSRFNTQEYSGDLRFNKNKFHFRVGLAFKTAQLNSKIEYPSTTKISRNYQNLLPRVSLRYPMKDNRMLVLYYRTSTNAPPINKLLEAVNNTNPLQLTNGNAELDQEYRHGLFTKYATSNANNNTSFHVLAGGSYYTNFISSSTYIAEETTISVDGIVLEPGTQYSKPTNVSGYYDIYFYTSYSLPVGFLKSNFSIGYSTYFKRTPSYINEKKNIISTPEYRIDLGLSSNISEKIDFNIMSKTSLNYSLNSLNPSLNTDYFRQNTTVSFYWNFWKDFNTRSSLEHNYFNGLNTSLDPTYTLWNLSIGYKFLKDKKAEISLYVFDVLRQNNAVNRTTTDRYIQDTQTQVLQQYYMLTFRYNLQSFAKNTDEK